MDKTREGRRAKPSITTQSGSDFKKLRREKVRRLSFVETFCTNSLDSEMPCVQSDDEEDEYHPCTTTSKRIKLPRKFFDDCQKVDHASVPRKLRSAIRKRSRESVSLRFPEVRKLNHSANGIELVKKDGIKKSKLKQHEESDGSPGLTSVMPITKDEEEVVETLYALAGMFSDSDKTETAQSTVPEVEKDLQTTFTTTAADAAQDISNIVGSAGEIVGVQFSNRRTEFDMHRCKQYPTESLNYIPKSNCTKLPIFSKSSSANENRSSNSSFPSHSELSREIGLKRPMHNLNLAYEINKEIAVESVATFKGHNELRLGTRENRNNGSALWPGLSSTCVHGAKTLGSPEKLSAAKLPAWLGISTSTAKSCSSRNVSIAEKESQSVIDAKMGKKCSTHVYISRLIRVLKVTEANDSLPVQPTRLTAHEGSTQGTISEHKKLHQIKNGLSGVVFINDIACSGGEDSPSKLSNAILLHKRLRDDQQASANSGPGTTDKQRFNIFAASDGSCGVEHESGGKVNGHRPELSTQSNFPYLHPFTQSCTTNPLSRPKNDYISTLYFDSAAAGAEQKVSAKLSELKATIDIGQMRRGNLLQTISYDFEKWNLLASSRFEDLSSLTSLLLINRVQIQLPPYLSNSTSGTSSLTGLQKQQQHQQRLWAAQLTAPCKPEEFAAAASPIANWQNSRQEFAHIMQYGQLIHPAALEVLGPRYIPVSTQHQLISSTSLFPQTRVQKYNHHQLSTSNVVNGGVFRPDSRASMPLL